jgi:hypothetical protein
MVLGSRRVVGVTACGLVLAGWLLGSTLSPPVARMQERGGTRTAAAPLPALTITRLDDLASAGPRPGPPAPARNPFAFGRGEPDRSTTPAHAVDPQPVTDDDADTAPIASAAAAEWRLLGLAVSADGAVTGVIGGAGDVHLVRAGDRLPGDVTVIEVVDSAVRIQRADGTVIELRLP